MNAVYLGSGWWWALLGWPALFAGAVAFCLAQARRSRPWAVAGCLLVAPTFLYLSLTPAFRASAPVAFALLCVLAWRAAVTRPLVASLLALPAAALVAWLALGAAGLL